jgi:endonuclease IV
MMIRIGYSVWREDFRRISSLVGELMEAGFDHVELSIDSPLDLYGDEIPVIADTARKAGLSLGIHIPWREIFLASPVEEIRSASSRVVRSIIENTYRYEPSYYVLHGSSDQPICSKNEDICISSLGKSIEEIIGSGGRIAIETIQGSCCGKTAQIAKLVNRYSIDVCIDLAHIAVENMVRGRNRWPSRISEALSEVPDSIKKRSWIIHLHGLKNRDKRIRAHHDFSYTPLGGEDIARAARNWGSAYIVFEVFYRSSGEEARPIDLSIEVRRMREWISILEP